MARFRCNVCSDPPKMAEFESRDKSPPCPVCKAQGQHLVARLVDVHLLAHCESGKLQTSRGAARIACQPERARWASHPEMTGEFFSCTPDPRAATCPRCKATADYKQAMAVFGEV